MTSSMPWKRAPSCATGPRTEGLPYCLRLSSIRQSSRAGGLPQERRGSGPGTSHQAEYRLLAVELMSRSSCFSRYPSAMQFALFRPPMMQMGSILNSRLNLIGSVANQSPVRRESRNLYPWAKIRLEGQKGGAGQLASSNRFLDEPKITNDSHPRIRHRRCLRVPGCEVGR